MISVRGEQIQLSTSSFVAMTYNVWGEHHIARRLEPNRQLFALRPPDVMGVQELRPEMRGVLDAALTGFRRVDDPFPGWSTQGNIWWRESMFELLEYGFEDVGILSPNAGLFWVRLKPLAPDSPAELVFSTAHLTYQRHPDELADLVNRRIPQARNIVAALEGIAAGGAIVFTADMNDTAPAQQEFGFAGYLDSFTALGRNMPSTHPIGAASTMGGIWSPTSPIAGVRKGLDVLFSRGPLVARSSEVVDFYYDGQVPSDHAPVTATYTFTRGRR